MTAPAPDIRFHLPPGPPVKPKRWQRTYKWPIRIATVLVVLGTLIGGAVAIAVGFVARSEITAIGAVTVDCETRAAVGTIPVRFGDRVDIYDANESSSTPMATTHLVGMRRLAGGTCLASFEVHDLHVVRAYVVRIGDSYRQMVTPAALEGGYLFA